MYIISLEQEETAVPYIQMRLENEARHVFKYPFSISSPELVLIAAFRTTQRKICLPASSAARWGPSVKFWPMGCEQKWYVLLLGYALKERRPDLPVPSFFLANLHECRCGQEQMIAILQGRQNHMIEGVCVPDLKEPNWLFLDCS